MDDVLPPVDATLDLTSIITNQVAQIELRKTQASKFREMLQSIFDNDPTYQTHDATVKEASKVRSATKKQILRLPQAADLAQKIADLRTEIRDINKSLSEYLADYQKDTGLMSIETEDGVVRQIVYTARLVKPPSKPNAS